VGPGSLGTQVPFSDVTPIGDDSRVSVAATNGHFPTHDIHASFLQQRNHKVGTETSISQKDVAREETIQEGTQQRGFASLFALVWRLCGTTWKAA
jgi:hypothetical protein